MINTNSEFLIARHQSVVCSSKNKNGGQVKNGRCKGKIYERNLQQGNGPSCKKARTTSQAAKEINCIEKL